MYYHARCDFRGSVDFVCPRGWCFITDCNFSEARPDASVWHDGHLDKAMKFVLANCKFTGVDGFSLARHHIDAQFFFLNCTFAKNMANRPPLRVVYPMSATKPSAADIFRNKQNDKLSLWGERSYFFNCHRDGGNDFAWFKDNLSTAPASPAPDQITAAWTFAGKWDPENSKGPAILKIERKDRQIRVKFSEPVTVKGNPRAILSDGNAAAYVTGSGTDALLFAAPSAADAKSLDLNGGWIIASQADAAIRNAELVPPS
jgi:pectinesterase